MQRLIRVKSPNDELVDFESPDAGTTDRQLTDREGAHREGANADRRKRQHAHRLCADGYRGPTNRSNCARIPAVVDACMLFKRRHRYAPER